MREGPVLFPETDNYLPDGWTIKRRQDELRDEAVLLIDGVTVAAHSEYRTRPERAYIIADQHRDLIAATLMRAVEMEHADYLRERAEAEAEAEARRAAVRAEANAAVDAWISGRHAAPFESPQPKVTSSATLKSTTAAGAAIWRGRD